MLIDWLSWGLISLNSLAPAPVPPPTGLQFVKPDVLRGIPLAELPYGGFELPQRVDLSEHMPTPGFQGKQNSCVAWVSAYAVKTYQEKLEQRSHLTQSGQPNFKNIFSPAFVYNQINNGRDGGATLIDALNVLSGRGAVSWAEMPYEVNNFKRQPSPEHFKSAKRYRIAYWRQVNIRDHHEVKAQLMAGYPVMIGALVDTSFYHLKPATIWRKSSGKSLGGHAMVLVGYDDHRQAYKVMNSWGPYWAEHGFGWIEYKQFGKAVREGYVAKDAPNAPAIDLAFRQIKPDTGSLNTPTRVGASPKKQTLKEDKSVPQSRGAVPQNVIITDSEPLVLADPESSNTQDSLKVESEQGYKLQNDVNTASSGSSADVDQLSENSPAPIAQHEEIVIDTIQLDKSYVREGVLWFEGSVTLPADIEGHFQVLVRFYNDTGNLQAVLNHQVKYQLPNKNAVAISAEQAKISPRHYWQASIPLSALPANAKSFRVKPVLYVDHFGVDSGKLRRIQIP